MVRAGEILEFAGGWRWEVDLYLFYVDESGNTGANLRSEDQPVHWMVALGLSAPGIRGIEVAMSEIARKYFHSRSEVPEFEFHGGDIFAGRGDCRGLHPDRRVRLYHDLLRLIEAHDGRLFVRGIHKHRHRLRAEARDYRPEHPHRLGFMYLVECLDEWLESQQPAEGAPPVYGLVAVDEQREVGREIVESFAFWRGHGTDHGYRAREIQYFVDCVHFLPSHDSWLIQLTDCIAYIRNRYARVIRSSGGQASTRGESDRAVVELWRSHCLPRIVVDRTWPQQKA